MPFDLSNCKNINTLEKEKFTLDTSGELAIRVVGDLNVTPTRGETPVHDEVTVNDTTWTLLTANMPANLIQFSVRNDTNVKCKVNGDNSVVGFVGMPLPEQDERAYNDVAASFVLYAKCETGTITLDVEGMPSA